MSTAPVGNCRYPTTALGGMTTATSAQAAAWARTSSRRSRTSSTPAPRCPLARRVRSCRSSTWHEAIRRRYVWRMERFRFPLNRTTPNERFSRNCSQKTSVTRLHLPAKSRASPLRNVRIIDLLKVEKACLQNSGKMRTSVGGDRREQTHCFHDRHIGGGDLGKHIFFQSGLQRRLRADDFDTKGTAGHAL